MNSKNQFISLYIMFSMILNLLVACAPMSREETQIPTLPRKSSVSKFQSRYNLLAIQGEFQTNRKIWNDLSIDNYEYDIEPIFLCPDLYMDYEYPITVVVRDSVVPVSVRDKNGVDLKGHARECMRGFDTINRIIAFIESDINSNPDRLEIEYDPLYGIPTRFSIDYDVNMVDSFLTLTINRFIVLNKK